jgi:type I restriction enzyme S subunit
VTAVKHVRLHDVAGYSDTRISSSILSVKSYVGTENLIEGKLGVIESSYMPEKGQCIEYQKGDTLIGNIRPYLKKIWLILSEFVRNLCY